MTDRIRLQRIDPRIDTEIAAFMEMGRAYLEELQMEPDWRGRFLNSIIRRQAEPNRWLLWLRLGGKTVGFAYLKTEEDAADVGWILEYYVMPLHRRVGIGRSGVDLAHNCLRDASANRVVLTACAGTMAFWRSCGYRNTGKEEHDDPIMECAL